MPLFTQLAHKIFMNSKHLQNLQDFDKIPPVSFLNHQSLQCADLGVCVYKTKRCQKNLSLILCISTKSDQGLL